MILFQNDWREQGAVVHHETKNLSFIKLHLMLKRMGVQNNKFMLALHNPELAKYDPHHLTDPSLDLRVAIMLECQENIWYYLREVIRIPAQGGEPIPYGLNRANLALTWVFSNNIDVLSIQPRQTGKTIGGMSIESHITYFKAINYKSTLYTKDRALIQENVTRLKEIRDGVPSYLLNKNIADIDNKEGLSYTTFNNVFQTKVAQKDKTAADRLGRGTTTPHLFIDEPPFCPNFDITYPIIQMSTTTARIHAENNGQPHANILTTTAGHLDTPEGAFVYKIYNSAMQFDPSLYDCKDRSDLVSIVKSNSTNDMIVIVHSYLQLGRTREWLNEQVRRWEITKDVLDREYFNIWKSGTSSAALDTETIDAISENKTPPAFVERVDRYMISWYVPKEVRNSEDFRNRSFVIGADCSENVGQDFTTFLMMDASTMAVVATMRCNDSNLISIGLFVLNFLVMFPKALFIPERNSTGVAILDVLFAYMPSKGMNPFKRIYNSVIQELGNNEEFRKIDTMDNNVSGVTRKWFGFRTVDKTRRFLYKNTFRHAMSLNTNRLYDQVLISELCTLQQKGDRVDHPAGGHDDMVIAYLLCAFLLFSGKNLHRYCIDPNDVLSAVSETGKKVDPEYRAYQEELREKIKKTMQLIQTSDSEIVKNRLRLTMKQMMAQVDDSLMKEPLSIDMVQKNKQDYTSPSTNIDTTKTDNYFGN